MNDVWSELFSFANYGELLVLVRNSILAGAVLGLAGGLVGVFVMARDLPFAVHAISELSFAGAAAGLLGVFLDCLAERLRCLVNQPGRLQQIQRNRLCDRNTLAGMLRLDGGLVLLQLA